MVRRLWLAPLGIVIIELVGPSDCSVCRATVWTDFKIGDNGYTRMLILDQGLTPLRLAASRAHP